jgi:cyclophilin family peptidyl-prolyl cis-trans isomerase
MIGNISSSSNSTDYRTRLVEFYNQHNPDKLDTVDETLARFQGKEEELFQKLHAKYIGRRRKEDAAASSSPFMPPSGEGPLCYLDFSVDGTNVGRVVVKLYLDRAPLASENFRCLCTGEKGMGRSMKPLCYAGHRVHRIVPGFVVQMGDFTRGDGRGGESIYPPNSEHGDPMGRFPDDRPFLQHARGGLLSMANSGRDTNGSQVFFTLRPTPHLDGKHVVFGEVVEGMDVLERIGKVPTDHKQFPLQPVVIEACGEIKQMP